MALTRSHHWAVALLLLACLGGSLLAAGPVRASQPPAAGLLATATGAVDHATGQIVAAPADAAAQVTHAVATPVADVPQVAGAAVVGTGAVEKAAEPVLSGAGAVVHELPAPVTRTLDTATGTVRGAAGIVRAATGTGGGAVGTDRKIVTPPVATAPGVPGQKAEPTAPAPQPSSSPPVAAAAALPQSSSSTPVAPLGATREIPASPPDRTHTASTPTAFDASPSTPEIVRVQSSRPAARPDRGTGHGPLRPPVPGGTPGASLSAVGGGIAFVLILFSPLLAWLPKLARRLRPATALLSGRPYVLVHARPG